MFSVNDEMETPTSVPTKRGAIGLTLAHQADYLAKVEEHGETVAQEEVKRLVKVMPRTDFGEFRFEPGA